MASASTTPLEFTQKETIAINHTIHTYSNIENECKPLHPIKRNGTSAMFTAQCLDNGKEYQAIIGIDFANNVWLRLRK